MLEYLIFGVAALITLGAGIAVVTEKNILHSAFFLVLSFFGVAALYVMLEAPFLAVAQILIYIGAIAVLIIFAIMLTRRLLSEDLIQRNAQWFWSALGALAFFGVLTLIIFEVNWPVVQTAVPEDPIVQLGEGLLSTYLIPFEIASVLLLAALIGAIIVGRENE
jgi:NADH-quinone oxidoreductase subunit J